MIALVWAGSAYTGWSDDATNTNATVVIGQEFARLDRDQDQRLTLAEFLGGRGRQPVLERDFRLYDLDESGRLTRSEFASVSGLVDPSLRGKLPDPFDDLVDNAVAALDESYGNWNQRPNELVNAHIFVANFIGSISPGGKRYVTGRILRQADGDADGRLSRSEAKRFLQQQLGIRWHSGPLLREPTGRLVRMNRFIDADQDQSNSVSRREFSAAHWDVPSENAYFLDHDRDQNGSISYLEYAHYTAQNFFDPIEWFRGADVNLNATLDAEEIATATEPSRQHLVGSTLSGFDSDDDKQLSLQEYRVSMHANVNYSWQVRPVDTDRDGWLSYDEFVFSRVDLFQLQRRYYFHRLDSDGDGRLSLSEFNFQTQRPFAIHLISVDGKKSRQIYQDREFPICGWPSVSSDGNRVLFHRCPPSGYSQGRIVIMDLDGSNLRDLCDGMKPSWSPDGRRFACQRTTGNAEVWIMNAETLTGQRITDGSSPRWSPDGESIAYLHDHGVWIYDVRRGQIRQLHRREDHRYQDLGDAIAWSPDSKRLALIANLSESSELVILQVNKENEPRVRHAQDAASHGNLNWDPNQQIVFCLHQETGGPARIVTISPDDNLATQPMSQFDEQIAWKSACLTPDGKWYIAVSENEGR